MFGVYPGVIVLKFFFSNSLSCWIFLNCLFHVSPLVVDAWVILTEVFGGDPTIERQFWFQICEDSSGVGLCHVTSLPLLGFQGILHVCLWSFLNCSDKYKVFWHILGVPKMVVPNNHGFSY